MEQLNDILLDELHFNALPYPDMPVREALTSIGFAYDDTPPETKFENIEQYVSNWMEKASIALGIGFLDIQVLQFIPQSDMWLLSSTEAEEEWLKSTSEVALIFRSSSKKKRDM